MVTNKYGHKEFILDENEQNPKMWHLDEKNKIHNFGRNLDKK